MHGADPDRIGDRRGRGCGNNPTIWEPGADPPASLVNGLFEPINAGDTSGLPTQLGMNKTDFFGDYGNGWGWRKAMCS